MQDFTMYSLYEGVALVFSVLVGTGAYLGYMFIKKGQKYSKGVILLIILVNFFITNLISEFLRLKNFGEYRSVALPLAAFGGQYFMDWIDRNYLKIFDAAAKKGGLDLKKEDNEQEEDYSNEQNNLENEKENL